MVNEESKQKNIEILISTMYKTSLSFLSDMFPEQDYLNYNILIINQTTKNKLLSSNHDNVRVFNSYEKGLSLSRNLALKNASAEICLLADDDVTYVKNFDEIIASAYRKYNSADIITFQMENENGKLYNDYPNTLEHNKKTVNSVNSVVITFNRLELIRKKVFFNTNFGLGAIFGTADEYVFLRSALRAKMKIYFEPEIILRHPNFSSGKAVLKDEIIFARSAVFFKYNGFFTYFKLVWHLFLLWKYDDLRLNQFFEKYKVGLLGIKKYKSLLKQGLEKRNN